VNARRLAGAVLVPSARRFPARRNRPIPMTRCSRAAPRTWAPPRGAGARVGRRVHSAAPRDARSA